MSDSSHPPPRFALAFARLLVTRPGAVLLALLALLGVSTWATSKLTINSNQLDLISQDLPEVQDVKRVIDMVGGSGHLMLGLRGDDVATLKKVADDLAAGLQADKENVRTVTYKLPVEFAQEKMVLFIETKDLAEGRRRIMAYLRDQIRRSNPFFFEIKNKEPVKLELEDLIQKYSSVGKRSIRDEYNLSLDNKMLMVLIKPMWDSNELGKTKVYVEKLRKEMAAYAQRPGSNGVKLEENYDLIGKNQDGTDKVLPEKTVIYGFAGSYKTAVDDSYAIEESLEPVSLLAFAGIFLITIIFFRKVMPTIIVSVGTVVGTIMTMGFAYITVGELNMITSILGALLLGFGIDYGIHLIFRTRLELGQGKPYDVAIQDAVINAGRPALVSAVVTAGAFFMLLASEFRGFSQFGFLSGVGTFILAFVLYLWCPAILAIAGRINPELPLKLIGKMPPPSAQSATTGKELRIPRPGLILAVSTVVVGLLCAVAIPWSDDVVPAGQDSTVWQRVQAGVRFNYNTRALIPEDQPSVKMQDEIGRRFGISADPVAVYTKTLEEAREVYDTIKQNPEKYSSIDQVVSVYTFVPDRERAEANARILAEWKEELKDIDVKALPPEAQERVPFFEKVLAAKPYGIDEVPENYRLQFRHLPTTKPENHGYLTFIYPGVDLWDGKKMLEFADQTTNITAASGKVYRAAGPAPLYARLARIVLKDGQVAILLTTLWILLMHFLDFRNVKLALASVIPLTVGLAMMLGIMTLVDLDLNFMNIIILPILLGFGVSHGLYLLHRFLEGTSPLVALRSVGAAVASSTLTTAAGFAALLVAEHKGLQTMGMVACIGLITTLVVSFTVLAAVMQVMHDQRSAKAKGSSEPSQAA
jgi:hypothetical protein